MYGSLLLVEQVGFSRIVPRSSTFDAKAQEPEFQHHAVRKIAPQGLKTEGEAEVKGMKTIYGVTGCKILRIRTIFLFARHLRCSDQIRMIKSRGDRKLFK